MRKTLLIILAIAISMTVLSNSLNAATSEQDATQPDFLESTAMAELQTAAEDECEHDFKEWSYRSTSDIDGTKYHHRECKKCGYIECGLHENRYGGCSICDYGIFDFSTVNFSDTFGMTSTELRKYMSDIFGETNIYDDSFNYFEVNRGDFLNLRIYAGKPDFGETKIPDFVECLRIHMNIWDPTEEQLNGCFYLMDGIKMGDTRGHMLSEAEARGYKVKTKDKAFDEKLVTIDDGKSIFEFKYYAHKNEDGSYDDDPNEYVEEGYLFACRDCYGGSHPQHDLSDISIDGILGMEVDEGTARLKEAFGEECVEVSDSDRVIVDRREVPGYCDFVFLQFYAKKVGSKYIFNSISAGGFSDHVDMKPNIISDMPNTMTVQEINKLAEEMGATIYEQDDTLYFQDVPEGSKTIIYHLSIMRTMRCGIFNDFR